MTAYEKYKEKVRHAQMAGYTDRVIAEELQKERDTILPRCAMKQATLARDRNIYKRREVARLARECMDAIDRVLNELASPAAKGEIV